MQTQPMFDDVSSKIEYAARVQMDLDDDWRVESMATGIQAGVEDRIDELEDSDLSDGERWRDLSIDDLPMA